MTEGNILGLSFGYHDAAVSVIDQSGNILFAGHSERYSKVKNDSSLSDLMFNDFDTTSIGSIAYYETSWKKQLRHLLYKDSASWKNLSNWSSKNVVKQELERIGQGHLVKLPIESFDHHMTHAAAGFQTSSFDDATVVVVDAIGEWDCVSIWQAHYDYDGRAHYKKVWNNTYPNSLGLFYSAFTQRCGLKPMEEEYILMGMSAYGKPVYLDYIKEKLIADSWNLKFTQNLQIGLDSTFLPNAENENIAASAQQVLEDLLQMVFRRASNLKFSRNLVFMGGVALNCVANRFLGEFFDHVWIMPNPGDAGSSLGAAALAYGKRLNWQDAYLGHVITGEYPVMGIIDSLVFDKITGVASGAAEFGPRAFGHRSLLADPRGFYIKDMVNVIKKREKFRPFAPVILEEFASGYFDMPKCFDHSRYMQVVARCKYPKLYPAIVHVDGTSRVQTVPKNSRSGMRRLLEVWFAQTGCPLLLNTSLNIKGEPMVNDRADADRFEQRYRVKVHS